MLLPEKISTASTEIQKAVKASEKAVNDFSNTSETASKKTSSAWSKISTAAKNVNKVVGASFTTIGKAAFEVGKTAVTGAIDLDKAMNQFAAATGTATEDLSGYEDTLKKIYANNYGASFDDIANAMVAVKQSMGDLDEASLQSVTESAFLLRDTFNYDINESMRTATILTKSFGIDGEKAMALIAKGAQNGLDVSGNLLSTINQYAEQFAEVGLSADDMFQIMQKGAETGDFALNQVGDAIKEMSSRVTGGTAAAAEGFTALGFNADDMAAKFSMGGDSAKEAFNQVIASLASMKDPIAQNAAGAALFGSTWESLGPEVVAQLASIEDGAYATADELGKIANVKYDSLGDMFSSLSRQVELLIIPIGEALIPVLAELLENVLPMLAPLLENMTVSFESMVPPLMTLIESIMPPLMELSTALMEPLSVILDQFLPRLIEILNQLLPPLLQIITELLPPLLDILFALMEPVLDFIEAMLPSIMELLAPLIELCQALSPILSALANVISNVLGAAFEMIDPIISAVMDVLGGLIDFITGVFSGSWEKAWEGIVGLFKGIFNLIPSIIEFIINGAIGLINLLIGGINKLTGAIGIPAIPLIPEVKLPRFHAGGIVDFHAGEVPALLQNGEMVLTRAQQKVLFDIANGRQAPVAGSAVYVESAPIYLDGRLISQNATQHQFTDVKVRRYR